MSIKMLLLGKNAPFLCYSILRNYGTKEFRRYLNLSCRTCDRKLAVENSDEHNFVKNESFHSEENSHSFDDYFGIESNEGAIIIDDTSNAKLHNPTYSFNHNIIPAVEKVYVTSFGNLRKDSENMPIYHGQYDMSISEATDLNDIESQSNFPYRTKVRSSIKNIMKNDTKRNPTMKTENIGQDKAVIHSIFSTNPTNESYRSKSLSFTNENDESLTVGPDTEKNVIDNTALHFSGHMKHPLNVDMLNKDIDTELQYNETKEIASSKCSDNLNFIDQTYFSGNSKSSTYDIKSTTEHHIKQSQSETNANASRLAECNDNLNFMDESYFPEINKSLYNSDDTGYSTKNNNQNSQNKTNINSIKYDQDFNFVDQGYFSEICTETDGQDAMANVRFVKKSAQDSPYDSEREMYKNIKYSESKTNFQNQSNNEFTNSIQGKIYQTHLSQNATGVEQLSILSETHSAASAKAIKGDLPKQNEQHSTSIAKSRKDKSVESNTYHTAQEFIKDIRANTTNYSLLKEKTIASRETLDSKGFRILENQVLKLSYFTKDEIFEILRGSVIYSDERIVVLNKPYNLVIHDSITTKDPCLSTFLDDLAKDLDRQNANPKLFTIHRLDKETTGCLLLARDEVTAQYLKSLFAQRTILKTYWIVTTKVPDPLEGVIDIPVAEGRIENRMRMVLSPEIPSDVNYSSHARRGKRAISHYKVKAISGNAALVEVKPETGIKHQIRVHFGFGLNCPILGDHKYSHLKKLAPQKLQSDLLQRLNVRQSKVRHIPMHIHARDIVIPSYSNGQNLFVSAPLPEHMQRNLKTLKFRKKDSLKL